MFKEFAEYFAEKFPNDVTLRKEVNHLTKEKSWCLEAEYPSTFIQEDVFQMVLDYVADPYGEWDPMFVRFVDSLGADLTNEDDIMEKMTAYFSIDASGMDYLIF